jgi:hypothetical protein
MVLLESHYRADWIRQRGDTDCLGSLVARALVSLALLWQWLQRRTMARGVRDRSRFLHCFSAHALPILESREKCNVRGSADGTILVDGNYVYFTIWIKSSFCWKIHFTGDQEKLVKQLGPDHPSFTLIQKHKTQSRSINPDWYKKETVRKHSFVSIVCCLAVTYLGLLMVWVTWNTFRRELNPMN